MIKSNVAFAQFVNSIMIAERIPHSEAWQRAAQLKPDLNKMMMALGATRARVHFANARYQRETQNPASNASRIEARTEFHQKAHDYMGKYNVDYDAAYRACRRQFANLAEGMTTSSGSAPALHGKTSVTYPAAPLVKSELLAFFGLPDGTSQKIFTAAFEANGKQTTELHAAKVFDGLVNYFMDEKSISHDAAIDYCKAKFPNVWSKLEDLAKIV